MEAFVHAHSMYRVQMLGLTTHVVEFALDLLFTKLEVLDLHFKLLLLACGLLQSASSRTLLGLLFNDRVDVGPGTFGFEVFDN